MAKLKPRFGKNANRPIYQKFYDKKTADLYAEKWDKIFGKKKEVKNEIDKKDD
jgi:hypothetical protein